MGEELDTTKVWLANMRDRAEQAQRRGTLVQEQLREVTGHASSPDGAVSVAVNAGGALSELQLGVAAEQLSAPSWVR